MRSRTRKQISHATLTAIPDVQGIGLLFPVGEAIAEGAVVAIERVAIEVPLLSNVILDGLKLQLDSGGKPEHIEGERTAEPLKPLTEAKFRTVDPECPGAVMSIVVGFAATVNVGDGAISKGEVSVVAPRVAEMVTGVFEVTVLVVTGKAAVALLKGTVTFKGTVARAVLELDRVTTVPPEGAGDDNVTVPCEAVPPVTVAGLRARPERLGGWTVIETS